MNKTIKKLVLLALTFPFFFTSCGSDDNNNTTNPTPNPEPRGVYDNGVFVLNEGGGNPATASITFISDSGTVEQDIFRNVNPDAEEIGSYLQNIFFDDNNAYIVSGQANSITVVNRYTFEYVATISENLTNPRYGVVYEGKAFVTNMLYYPQVGGFVAVINLSDYSTSVIPFGNVVTERIIEKDGKIYVSNGQFGSGNSITVIDAQTAAVEDTIDFGEGNVPNTIDEKDGFLYVLTSNFSGSSKIHKINMTNIQDVSQKVLHDSIAAPEHLTIEDNVIYFTNSTSVYSLPLNDFDNNDVNPSNIFSYQSNSQYGSMYGFAVEDGKVYVADAPDFISSAGTVYIYSLDGVLQTTHTVGVGPNGFYFND